MNLNQKFYENINRDTTYTIENLPEEHPFYSILIPFLEKWRCKSKRCLEIGCSKGLFQNFVDDYTGVDIAPSLSKYYSGSKKFVHTPDERLPFQDNEFDVVFTYATHEHIPELETALNEIIRVLKPGGICLFAPAWHTRSWFAQGYQVRPYSDLSLREKLIKFSIPFREFVLFRWPMVISKRLMRLIGFLLSNGKPLPLKYKRLNANYEFFWQSDSDACNSLDPFDVVLWFKSRGLVCHGYQNLFKSIFIRTYGIEIQKPAC